MRACAAGRVFATAALALLGAAAHGQGVGNGGGMATTPNCSVVVDAAGGAMRREQERREAMQNPIDEAMRNIQNICYGQLRSINTTEIGGFAFSAFLSAILNGQVQRACNELLGQLYRARLIYSDPRQVLPGVLGSSFPGVGSVGVPVPPAPAPAPALPPAPAAAAPVTPPQAVTDCPPGLSGTWCRINPWR